MELLRELIYVFKRDSTCLLNEILPEESEARKLFDLVLKENVNTDEEAAELIYGSSSANEKYHSLKKELSETLLDAILKEDILDNNNKEKISLNGKKELLLVEKLLDRNVYHNAEKILEKIKLYAEKFQILELQRDCVKHLRTVYTLKGYPKEVEFYNIVLAKLNRFLQYDQQALGFIDLLESKNKYAIGKYREIAVEAKHYFVSIKEWQKESSSTMLRLYQYKVELIRCYHANDTREWAYVLSRLDDLLKSFPFLRTELLLLNINIEWSRYLRCTANIAEAGEYIRKALLLCNYAAFNKFEVQALNFDLKIKENNYSEAAEILVEVEQCAQFALLDPADQAAWELRKAYLYFIFSSLKDDPGIRTCFPALAGGFPVQELVEKCRALSHDRKGYYFMLVVIKEALLKQTQPDQKETKAGSLLAYYQKYMMDSCEERSKSFIKRLARAGQYKTQRSSAKSDKEMVYKSFDAPELIPYGLFDQLLATEQ